MELFLYGLSLGAFFGLICGIRIHRKWYLWIARHDPSNQIQNQNFWNK